MEEEYRQFVDSYEVSNIGNCRRKLLNGNYKYIKCSILGTGGGYKYFQITREGKRKNYLIHHAVAHCFIGERPDGLVIDHIDRDPLNNRVENLRYVTQKENVRNNDRFIDDIAEEDPIHRRKIVHQIYRDNNKEKISARNKAYYENNKDILSEKLKIYKDNNREDINMKARIYSKKPEVLERKRIQGSKIVRCDICNKDMRYDTMNGHKKTKRHILEEERVNQTKADEGLAN